MVSKSPRKVHQPLSILIHLSSIVLIFLSFKYLVDNPTFINDSYGWHWQYLTIIGMTMSQVTMGVALLADFTLSPTLFFIKNKLALLSAPLEVSISVLYWGLCAIDKSLVIPPGIYIHPLADFGFHALPTILLTIDFVFFSPPWNISSTQAFGISSLIGIAYWFWIEHCFSHNGFYPYPLFGQLNNFQRIILFSLASLIMTGGFLLLRWLYRTINGTPNKQGKISNHKSQ